MRAMHLSYTSREQVEVYRFSWLLSVGLPLLMVGLQAFLPVRLPLLPGLRFWIVADDLFCRLAAQPGERNC